MRSRQRVDCSGVDSSQLVQGKLLVVAFDFVRKTIRSSANPTSRCPCHRGLRLYLPKDCVSLKDELVPGPVLVDHGLVLSK